MKPFILLLLFICCSLHVTVAQFKAGDVPAGMSILDPHINFSITTQGLTSVDSIGSFDIDCDGTNDMRIVLSAGLTAIDAPHSVYLSVPNSSSFEICADTAADYGNITKFYNHGEVIGCSGNLEWKSDTIYHIASYGAWLPSGPSTLTDAYFTYRKKSNNQEGWIKISYNLVGQTLTLSISEILSFCSPDFILNPGNENSFYISSDFSRELIIHSSQEILHAEIINALGQRPGVSVSHTNGKTQFDISTFPAGIYLLNAKTKNGWRVTKFLK